MATNPWSGAHERSRVKHRMEGGQNGPAEPDASGGGVIGGQPLSRQDEALRAYGADARWHCPPLGVAAAAQPAAKAEIRDLSDEQARALAWPPAGPAPGYLAEVEHALHGDAVLEAVTGEEP